MEYRREQWETDFEKFMENRRNSSNSKDRNKDLDKEEKMVRKEQEKKDRKIYRNRKNIQNLIDFKKGIVDDITKLEEDKKGVAESIRQEEEALNQLKEEIEALGREIEEEEKLDPGRSKDGQKLRRKKESREYSKARSKKKKFRR